MGLRPESASINIVTLTKICKTFHYEHEENFSNIFTFFGPKDEEFRQLLSQQIAEYGDWQGLEVTA